MNAVAKVLPLYPLARPAALPERVPGPADSADLKLAFTIYKDVKDAVGEVQTVSWADIVALVNRPKEFETKSACPLFKLAIFRGARRAGNVDWIYGIEVDYDAEVMTAAEAAERLRAHGIEAIVYSTPSSKPGKPRWRVLVPLWNALRVPADPYSSAALDQRREYVAMIDWVLGGVLAPESYSPVQIYYVGRVTGAEYEVHHVEGTPIDKSALPLIADTDALLRARGLSAEHTSAVDGPMAAREQAVAVHVDSERVGDLLADLRHVLMALPIKYADDRTLWINGGLALKSLELLAGDCEDIGEAAFKLFDEFSARSPGKYKGTDATRETWDTFDPRSITWRSVFEWGRAAGIVNPRSDRRADPNAFENLDAQSGQPATLSYVDFASLAHSDPPARRWIVDQWLPRKTVTALFGRGGHGKSLLSEQLAFAVANGVKFLGLEVTCGPVLGIFCEDDGDELLRRGKAISSALFLQPGEGVADLHLDARAGKENMLVAFGPDNRANVQALLVAMRTEIERVRPVLVIFDNIAQLFGGLENSRIQVTAFCNLLTAVAVDYDAAVLLLGHLAKAEGSEYSGSTGWDAAVRSRLLLERLDDGTSVLKKLKANYAATDEIRLEFRDGAFHRLVGSAGDTAALAGLKSQIIAAIERYTAREQTVSHLTTARNNLVKLMTDDGLLAEGSRRAARLALTALIDSGSVLVNQERSWKSTGRHRVFGLSLAPARPQCNLAEICTVDAGGMPGDLTGTGGG